MAVLLPSAKIVELSHEGLEKIVCAHHHVREPIYSTMPVNEKIYFGIIVVSFFFSASDGIIIPQFFGF